MPPDRAPGEVLETTPGSGTVERPRRTRLVVGIIAAVAIVLAAGGSVLAQRMAREARAADIEAVTTLAQAYLDAIEEGRAADATELAPVEGDASLLLDAVLGGAERISGTEVGAVEVDGDVASVRVAYRAWSGAVERSLDAARVGAGWVLTTSLAEPVAIRDEPALGIAPGIRGIPLALDGSSLLYPGAYGTDPHVAALWAYEPARVVVDGVPGGQPFGVVLSPRGSSPEAQLEIAAAHLAACQADGSCPLADGALTGQRSLSVLALGEDGGMTVRISTAALRSGEQAPAQLAIDVRGTVAEDGTPAWTCRGPVGGADADGAELAPCRGEAP